MPVLLNIPTLLVLLFAPVLLRAQIPAASLRTHDFASLEQTATTLNKPYFVFASGTSELQADSLETTAQQQPFIYSFLRIHFLGSYVGPVAMKNGFAAFRQLYRITETTLMVFDPAGRVIGRHTDVYTTGDLYRALYEDHQRWLAAPGPSATAQPVVNQRRITTPVPHPLEAEVVIANLPEAYPPAFSSGLTRSRAETEPAVSQYIVLNASLPGLRAYKPEVIDNHSITVIMGLYPTQPRLVSALQTLRTRTSLPCYAYLASDAYGTPFYVLSVGTFNDPATAWRKISEEIPASTPVCVGLLVNP